MIHVIKFALDHVDGWPMLIKCHLADDCFEIAESLTPGADLVFEHDVYTGTDTDAKTSDQRNMLTNRDPLNLFATILCFGV